MKDINNKQIKLPADNVLSPSLGKSIEQAIRDRSIPIPLEDEEKIQELQEQIQQVVDTETIIEKVVVTVDEGNPDEAASATVTFLKGVLTLAFVNVKGATGEALTFDDLTDEQKAELKGEKGDPLTFDDLTDEQKAELKGEPGVPGAPGTPGKDGAITNLAQSVSASDTTHATSGKAVADYVAAHGGGGSVSIDTTIPASPSDSKVPSTKMLIDNFARKGSGGGVVPSADEIPYEDTNVGAKLTELDGELNGAEINIPITKNGKCLKTYNVGDVADTTPVSISNFGYVEIDCKSDDVFDINVRGGQNGRAYAFIDANRIVLETVSSYASVNGKITAPNGSKKVIFNNDYSTVEEPSITKVIDAQFAKKSDIEGLGGASKSTNMIGLYLPNKKVLLAGASISTKNGYFEYAMKKMGLIGTNISSAGTNITYLAYKLYTSGNSYATQDVLLISHIHNRDVYTLPSGKDNYKASDYESDDDLKVYFTTDTYKSVTTFGSDKYTDDEIYAMGYDYCIKKWAELCYNLKDTEGYDTLAGKNFQIVLYTYWHDARTIFNTAIRKLAKKWGLPLIKDDENIGFSKDKIHPIANKQWSVLYCNGVPWSSKTEKIDGVTYGFHPSGISADDWNTFVSADAETMLSMLPYIQVKRASILIDAFKGAIY